jgi:hypothetical protein
LSKKINRTNPQVVVNELLGTDSREKNNCGEVVKAIILNELGKEKI